MDQIAVAIQQHGGGVDTGKTARSLWTGLVQVLTFYSVHTGESIHRFTRDICVNRRNCQRPRTGGDVDVCG